VFEVDVVRIEVLSDCARRVSVGAVPIHLEFEIGIIGNRVCPSSDHVCAIHAGVAVGSGLIKAAAVTIPLKG